MLEILNREYDELKTYIKCNADGKYDEKINNKILSLYCYILGYYSAKIDLNVNDSVERLKDKINLEFYDKKLIERLKLCTCLNYFVRPNSECKRAEFYDAIHFLKLGKHIDGTDLENLKKSFDDAYLATVLNKNRNKLSNRQQNKIYKIHKKSYKIIDKYSKK